MAALAMAMAPSLVLLPPMNPACTRTTHCQIVRSHGAAVRTADASGATVGVATAGMERQVGGARQPSLDVGPILPDDHLPGKKN